MPGWMILLSVLATAPNLDAVDQSLVLQIGDVRAGNGGNGGAATVNIYGGTIILKPQGGTGGTGGAATGSSPTSKAGSGCRVADPTGTPLNVRDSPNGTIIGALDNGISVRFTNRTSDGRWGYIVPARGKSGWVFADYVNCP